MDIDYEGAAEIERAWREGLTPDPLLTVSEWSDRHRMLSSKASAEPGRWRTRRTPYRRHNNPSISKRPPAAVASLLLIPAVGASSRAAG